MHRPRRAHARRQRQSRNTDEIAQYPQSAYITSVLTRGGPVPTRPSHRGGSVTLFSEVKKLSHIYSAVCASTTFSPAASAAASSEVEGSGAGGAGASSCNTVHEMLQGYLAYKMQGYLAHKKTGYRGTSLIRYRGTSLIRKRSPPGPP